MKKLMEIRQKHGISLQDMANFLGVSKTFYWQIENEKRRLSYRNAVRIADILQTKPDELFYEEFKNKNLNSTNLK